MRKEGYKRLLSSRDARVNIVLFASIIAVFLLTVVFTEAMTVTLTTPGNFTFNTITQRTINISFNATWFFGGVANESVSNCSLYVNSTTNRVAWDIAKNVSIDAPGVDNKLQNGSVALSYMRFNFSGDGNFTYGVACLNFSNSSSFTPTLTFSSNFTIFIDSTPPNINFTAPVPNLFNTTTVSERLIEFQINETGYGFNLTRNESINLSIFFGGTKVKLFTYLNSSGSSNLSCNATSAAVTMSLITCNATYNFNSNGTYFINVSADDALGNINTSAQLLTVDQIPPVIVSLNFSSNSSLDIAALGSNSPSTVPAVGTGTWAQGRQFVASANFTDNLTRLGGATFQFFNTTLGDWQTLNYTLFASFNTNTNSSINFTLNVTREHNEFEGKNVTFRIIANDTLANINTTGGLLNVTIQINDTTKPTLLIADVAGVSTPNLTNTTNTTPTIRWNTTELNNLRYLAIQFNSLTDTDCGFKNFTSVPTATANKNGSANLFTAAGCPTLSNGTNTVKLSAQDSWGNGEEYIHSFTITTSEAGPNISLIALGNSLSAVNGSNVTPYTAINFSVTSIGQTAFKNISFISSCNLTVQTFTNNSGIYPFNYSSGTCKGGVSTTQTVTVTTFDFIGNSQTRLYSFNVDDLGPPISANNPTPGFNGPNNITFNVSAKDGVQGVAEFGYFLDPTETTVFTSYVKLNTTNGASAANITNIFNGTQTAINLTPGTHTIKFRANDSLGNAVNTSVVTFTVTGPESFSRVRTSIQTYVNTTFAAATNIINVTVKIKAANVFEPVTTTNETSSNTFEITYEINASINVSLTEINGSAANWDKINFTPIYNATSTFNNISKNWSNTVIRGIVFNNSLGDFITLNNSYYGVVVIPGILNESNATTSTVQEFWWITDPSDISTRQNISLCTSAFTRTTTTPCYNHTSGGKTIVQVPHFSVVVAVNDTTAPTVNVTEPVKSNQGVGIFTPNITVSNDAVTCLYHMNSTTNASTANKTMTKSGNVCLASAAETLKTGGDYNITFTVIDAAENVNRYVWNFTVSDTTRPDNGTVSTSVGSTTATVTVASVNESVNATVNYGTVNTTLSSSATETDFSQTQAVSLTGLSASTTYYFNVSVCDFNGNCNANLTLYSLTTSAAAAAAAASTTSSSSGGGGGAAPVSNVAASTGTSWDSLAAGSSGTVAVKNEKIAVTSIVIDVKNTVTSPSVNVQSFTSNPLTTNAAAKVYQYLQLTKSNLADSDASKITINFKVPKSWLTSNNVVESDVVLYRYADSKWNGLPTSKTGDDGTNVLYESTTPGFSTFAVGNKEAAPVETPAETPTQAPTEAPAAETPAAPTETPKAPAMEEKTTSRTTMALIAIAIIVVVGALGYFLYQRKKDE